jgi:hypothetical protein
MTFDEACDILHLNMQGRYRGERSRLMLAIEIAAGDLEPGPEEIETIWGAVEIGGEA